MMNIISELSKEWQLSGLKKNDVVLLHSDIQRLLYLYLKKNIKLNVNEILDSFLNVIGAKGTLILPAFNFDFTKGFPFDLLKTPSQMGILTEYARKSLPNVRTSHPIYSFVVIGNHKNKFKELDNISAYSNDSPFGLLRRLNGKIAALNLDDQNCMTFYHHIEELNRVNYRYFKNFSGNYIDQFGIKSEKTFSIYVRDIERGVKTHLNPAGELLWSEKLYSGYRHNEGTGLRVINAQKMFDFVTKEIINKNKAEGLLYRIEK